VKIDKEILRDLIREEYSGDEYDCVFEGEWKDGGKYAEQQIVIKDNSTGKHYVYYHARSGSYFSSYEYGIDWESSKVIELTEVELKEVTIQQWVTVKENK